MKTFNVYQDPKRAKAYAKLEFHGTYYLAYRDLPVLINEFAKGRKALDFGCGTGRSTRFLKKLGFDAVGIDIAEDMISIARAVDSGGEYHKVDECDLDGFEENSYDLILSAFTFDNIPTLEQKTALLIAIRRLLKSEGVIINLVSTPEIYVNEWVSFSTRDFPGNVNARSGQIVRIIITDTEDKRPVQDVLCSDEDYRKAYGVAGLELIRTYKPLAREDEAYHWVNETRIAPWAIYILKKEGTESR